MLPPFSSYLLLIARMKYSAFSDIAFHRKPQSKALVLSHTLSKVEYDNYFAIYIITTDIYVMDHYAQRIQSM